MEKELADLQLGGVQYDEVSQIENLTKSLEKARKEYAKLNKEFQDSTNTSKKLADVWKEVAKTIVQELN